MTVSMLKYFLLNIGLLSEFKSFGVHALTQHKLVFFKIKNKIYIYSIIYDINALCLQYDLY